MAKCSFSFSVVLNMDRCLGSGIAGGSSRPSFAPFEVGVYLRSYTDSVDA